MAKTATMADRIDKPITPSSVFISRSPQIANRLDAATHDAARHVQFLFSRGKVQVKKGHSLSADWLSRGARTDLIARQDISFA